MNGLGTVNGYKTKTRLFAICLAAHRINTNCYVKMLLNCAYVLWHVWGIWGSWTNEPKTNRFNTNGRQTNNYFFKFVYLVRYSIVAYYDFWGTRSTGAWATFFIIVVGLTPQNNLFWGTRPITYPNLN